MNILEMRVYVVIHLKNKKDDEQKILTMELSVPMMKLHKDIDLKDIVGVFMRKRNATEAAKEAV